jgi:NAD-dependent DNA ligase
MSSVLLKDLWVNTVDELDGWGISWGLQTTTANVDLRGVLSEKLRRILIARVGLSMDSLLNLTEAEGWSLVYSRSKGVNKSLSGPEVCFTGFAADERVDLEQLASTSGLRVVHTITKKLSFLVAGDNAGPVKIKKARDQGVTILDRSQFLHLNETGELPS